MTIAQRVNPAEANPSPVMSLPLPVISWEEGMWLSFKQCNSSGNLLWASRNDALSYKETWGRTGLLLPAEVILYLLAHEGSQSEGKADTSTLSEGKDGEDLGPSWQPQGAGGAVQPGTSSSGNAFPFLLSHLFDLGSLLGAAKSNRNVYPW